MSRAPDAASSSADVSTPLATEELEFRAQFERVLGADYKLDRLIGEGGFGRVYAAMDVRLGRAVAIKVIRPELAGARAFLDRFRKEGTALAKFRHPGIVPIYDIREDDGIIYYVMPLVQGQTLREHLEKRGKLAPKETQRILIELCECVAATHRAGIIHRDIKPDNIILEGWIGAPLLMDFGIAKSAADASSTTSGMMVGTPTYMSPEQAAGETHIDVRSDIYSIGVLGYHMVTGRPPFEGRTAHQVIAAHITDAPVPVRKINVSVPKAMADAIEKCLAKDPDERFQSARELSEALQRVEFGIGELPIVAPTPNYAMPFFAGMALATEGAALLGSTALSGLSAHDLWYATVAFAGLSIMCSPFVRAATTPLSETLHERLELLFARFTRKRVGG